MPMRSISLATGGLILGLLVSACGGSENLAAPPTSTPTGAEGSTSTEQAPIVGGTYAVRGDGKILSVPVAVGGGCLETGTPTAEVVESDETVIVAVAVRRDRPPANQSSGPCTADQLLARVDVSLEAPVGTRRVIDAATGETLTRR